MLEKVEILRQSNELLNRKCLKNSHNWTRARFLKREKKKETESHPESHLLLLVVTDRIEEKRVTGELLVLVKKRYEVLSVVYSQRSRL